MPSLRGAPSGTGWFRPCPATLTPEAPVGEAPPERVSRPRLGSLGRAQSMTTSAVVRLQGPAWPSASTERTRSA